MGGLKYPIRHLGDKKVQLAVWRPSSGHWYIKGPGYKDWHKSHGNKAIQIGTSGDIPVPADYMAEGKIRMAVWRPSSGHWFIKGNGFASWGQTNGNIAIQCGAKGDIPVPGNYTGNRVCLYLIFFTSAKQELLRLAF